jgi:hypothetical protein
MQVGPALGGYVWAFSLSWGTGHQYFPFAMVGSSGELPLPQFSNSTVIALLLL